MTDFDVSNNRWFDMVARVISFNEITSIDMLSIAGKVAKHVE